MFASYETAAKMKDIKNALDSMGINTEEKEAEYFSDLVGELCYCMSLNNNEVKIYTNKENKDLFKRMNQVGECLNTPLMTADQRKIVDDYLSSCRLELANFIYEVGLNKFNNEVKSCAKKINPHIETNDILIMFARNIYKPQEKKENNIKIKKLEK